VAAEEAELDLDLVAEPSAPASEVAAAFGESLARALAAV
jgi:hypothetical protein